MSNHPNRSKNGTSPTRNPSPAEVRAAREAAGLSQTAAAALIFCSLDAWQQWEADETSGRNRRMHPAFWELFRLKVGRG